jgi:hypothetical protein
MYSLANFSTFLNPLNAEINPICHFMALLGAHPILHISRIRVNIVSIHKVHLTHTQVEPTYGHKSHDFIMNVTQQILA